jgi:O-methyltransferase involved in polyketide biosynthesis
VIADAVDEYALGRQFDDVIGKKRPELLTLLVLVAAGLDPKAPRVS